MNWEHREERTERGQVKGKEHDGTGWSRWGTDTERENNESNILIE